MVVPSREIKAEDTALGVAGDTTSGPELPQPAGLSHSRMPGPNLATREANDVSLAPPRGFIPKLHDTPQPGTVGGRMGPCPTATFLLASWECGDLR